MEKFVYVVTREDARRSVVFGVYSDPMAAMNAIWTLARGSIIGSIKEELVGTRYNVLNPETDEEHYYIERVALDEKFW